MVHFSISAETDMGLWCLHLTSCVPSTSGDRLGMSREDADCWMTSEGLAPLRHAPTLQELPQSGSHWVIKWLGEDPVCLHAGP